MCCASSTTLCKVGFFLSCCRRLEKTQCGGQNAESPFFVVAVLCWQQARDYDDDEYIAGVKGGRPGDQRGRIGGAAAAGGGPGGGLVRSGSEMSLPPGGDQRLPKRIKGQLNAKPGDAARMDPNARCVVNQSLLMCHTPTQSSGSGWV